MEHLENRTLLTGDLGEHLPSVTVDRETYDPSSILVRFRPEAAEANAARIVQGAQLGKAIDLVPGLRSVGLPKGLSVESALAAYRANPLVLYAEPNYRVQAALTTPNDASFSALYGLHNTGQTGGTTDADIDAPEAWDLTTGSQDVVVAVIDTGVDYNHPDLAANIWVNSGEIPGNNFDDDENGYVDDVHGYNFYNYTGDPLDDNFHGTHVAGTIGAVGNNGEGVAGVSWNVKIMALKFLDSGGYGYVEDALNAVNYATMMRNSGVNIRLTSNSWGGGGYSQAFKDAIDAGGAAGILFIAAAGNGGTDADASPMYPAAYDSPYVISVAATDHNDQYAWFSNWGATSVDLAAPGLDTYSTMPGGQYGLLSGTSMATPHVSGAAALVSSLYPSATPLQVKQRLLGGADYIGNVAGNASRPTLTNGRLNAFNSLENDAVAPDAISGLSVVGSGLVSVTLSWTATGDDGSVGTAASYDIRYSTSPIDETNWASATRAVLSPKPQAAGATETFTVSGLSPNQAYYFALRALDNVGNASPLSSVVQGSTQPAVVHFEDDLESGGAGWGYYGLWHPATWRSSSPDTAFYYGDDYSLTYDTYYCDEYYGCYSYANYGGLTSPLIDLTGFEDALLTFQEFRQVENLAPYDSATVYVSTDGVNWNAAWQSYSSTNGWVERAVDLTPWAGESVYIQFYFDTLDELYNYFEGWYVDDVKVWVAGQQEPGLYINNASVAEGDSGPGGAQASFTVSLVDLAGPVTFEWTTADGTAESGSDYPSSSGSLTIPAGDTSASFSVPVNGDGIDEDDETFFVNVTSLDAPVIDGQGRATILDDDTAGMSFSAPSGLSTSESGGARNVTVALNSQPAENVTVNLASSDTTEGTIAPAGLTFTPLNWNVAQSATVTGVNDLLDDGDIAYFVTASTSSGDGAYNGLSSSLSAMNLDNDATAVFSNNNVQTIADGGTITSTINVPAAHVIRDVNVQLSITHGRDQDLDVSLKHPGGAQIVLFNDVGGNGKHFNGTTLDDEAATAITAGSAPFPGSYRPQQALSTFDDKSTSGVWTLIVTDDAKGGQKGKLKSWSVTILYEVAAGGSSAEGLEGEAPDSDASAGANPWHNALESADVDGDGDVSLHDALFAVQSLRDGGLGELGSRSPGQGYLDVDNDGAFALSDLVMVVSSVRARQLQAASTAASLAEDLDSPPTLAEHDQALADLLGE